MKFQLIIFITLCVIFNFAASQATTTFSTTRNPSMTASGAAIQGVNSLDELSRSIVNQIRTFNPNGDKFQLYRNIRETTQMSIDLMKKNNVRATSDDVQRMVDSVKSQITDMKSPIADVNKFSEHLKQHLMMKLIGNQANV
jgi:hypothetical protein